MTPTEQELRIIEAVCQHWERQDLRQLGSMVTLLEQQEGLPAEFTFMEYDQKYHYDRSERAAIVHFYLQSLVEHKRLSGTSEASLNKMRDKNVDTMSLVLQTGRYPRG